MPVQVRLRAKAGSLPPAKARRRQNAIDNLNAVSKADEPIRSAARWQTATGLREPEKVCPASACADYVTDAVTHRRNHTHQSRTANPHAGDKCSG